MPKYTDSQHRSIEINLSRDKTFITVKQPADIIFGHYLTPHNSAFEELFRLWYEISMYTKAKALSESAQQITSRWARATIDSAQADVATYHDNVIVLYDTLKQRKVI